MSARNDAIRKRRANKRMEHYRSNRGKFQFRHLRRTLRKATEALIQYNAMAASIKATLE